MSELAVFRIIHGGELYINLQFLEVLVEKYSGCKIDNYEINDSKLILYLSSSRVDENILLNEWNKLDKKLNSYKLVDCTYVNTYEYCIDIYFVRSRLRIE